MKLLKAQGDAGQKIIKLALSNLYGKFAQNTGCVGLTGDKKLMLECFALDLARRGKLFTKQSKRP